MTTHDNEITRELRAGLDQMFKSTEAMIGLADQAASVAIQLLQGGEPENETARRVVLGGMERLREMVTEHSASLAHTRARLSTAVTRLAEEMGGRA